MKRDYFILGASLVVAAGCAALGEWQLDRRSQKRALNALTSVRLAAGPVELAALPRDTAEARFRRVHAAGRLDYTREYVLASRPREGSPGAYLLTPLIRAGTDTLVLVVRGWVYAPDGATVDRARWREADSADLEAYVLPYPATAPGPDSSERISRALRRLDYARLRERMGTPLAEYYLVMTSGAAKGDSMPARLALPALNDGPHLSYAVQWFLFATTFGAGGVVVVLRGRRRAPNIG